MLILLNLLFFVSIGSANDHVDFNCPELEPKEDCRGKNCCPSKYKRMYRDGEYICAYNGKYTHFEEDVNERGKTFKVKQSTGNCVNGRADGPAKSWSVDNGGNTIEQSGTFQKNVLVGASYTKSKEGIILDIACHKKIEGESEILWNYQQGELPEKPIKPNRKELGKDEFKEASKEYKAELSAYKKELKQMQVGSKFLSSLGKACPVASDSFCRSLPIDGLQLKLKKKTKKKKEESEEEPEFIEIKGEDPNEEVCDNELALKYESIPSKTNRRTLELVTTSLGIVDIQCRLGEDNLWSITQDIPKPASDDKEDIDSRKAEVKAFQATSKFLQKQKKACEQPTDAFCYFMENIDEGDYRNVTRPENDICLNGRAVTQVGDWRDSPRSGLRTLSTKLGIHEIQCVGVAYGSSSCGSGCTQSGTMSLPVWQFSQETPGQKPTPPKKNEYEDPEKFKNALGEHKEDLIRHKNQLADLKSFNKMIKPFQKQCSGYDTNESYSDALCSTLDQFDKMEDRPEGFEYEYHDDSPCKMGFVVLKGGKQKYHDFETYELGYHWKKIKPGYIEASCFDHKMRGKEIEDHEMIWEVVNEYPGKAPVPPKKKEYETTEDFKEAMAEHKKISAEHKLDMRIFNKKSKAIANLGKVCPKMGNNYCIASGSCTEEGACKWSRQNEECVVGNRAHCKQSLACIENGKCTYSDGQCIE